MGYLILEDFWKNICHSVGTCVEKVNNETQKHRVHKIICVTLGNIIRVYHWQVSYLPLHPTHALGNFCVPEASLQYRH